MDAAQAGLPYTSKPAGKSTLSLAEGSGFKVYFLEIRGRGERQKYEWAFCRRSQEEALRQLKELNPAGVGFIVIFPHIAKVFSFGQDAETNLYARAYGGDPFREIPLSSDRGVEIACAGEMDIAAREFLLWRRAASVEDYLRRFTRPHTCGFRKPNKLAEST